MTQSAQLNDSDHSFLISGGLLNRFLSMIGLGRAGLPGIEMRAASFVLVTYVPLLILALAQGVAYGAQLKVPFMCDVSEIVRFLVVGPLLLMAEAFVEPWLAQVVRHSRTHLIPAELLPEYDSLLKDAMRCRNSYVVEIALLIGIFFWQWTDASYLLTQASGTWQMSTSGPTWTWYWYAYIAKPLMRFVWLRWLWRYLIWSIFLCRMACLNLKTQPTHPDRHGGLAFIAVGHSKFSILALAFGAQAASIFGEQILVAGKTLMSFKYEIVGVLLIILFVFLTPLLAFTGKLLAAKREGLFEYGALADEYTAAFRAKWIGGGRNQEVLLGTSDIQSLADIGNSYEVVHGMKVCLMNKDNIMTFVLSTLLPFSPLVLTVYPFDELLNHLLKVVM